MKTNRQCIQTRAILTVLVASLFGGNAYAQMPAVSISATQPATSEPRPEARIIPGEFTVSRNITGTQPLVVYLQYAGSAMFGSDYTALPQSVTIPAGALSAALSVIALSDPNASEGEENVVANLKPAPPGTVPAYTLDPQNWAEVVIHDGPAVPPPPLIPVVTIEADGFPAKTAEPCPVCLVAPARITLARSGPLDHALNVGLQTGGTATPGVDYPALPDPFVIPAGAASASFFLTPFDDALAEGPEVVEISLRPSAAAYSIGDPGSVYAVIGDDDPDAPPERFDVVKPANGAVFPSGVPSIHIRALAVSTSGEIDRPAQFFANGALIGESHPPQYGRPSIPYLPRDHDMEWKLPADGQYILRARVEFSLNQWLETPPITVTVGPATASRVVSIVATQRIAEEDSAPTMRAVVFKGVFTVSRTGPDTNPQTVYLHVSGTAVSGKDYKALPFAVSIPTGSASTTIQVEAIPDNIPEPLETVIAEVSNCPPGPILPPCFDFQIDPAHSRDTVFIRDDGITRATLEITAPQDGAHFTIGQGIAIDATAIDIDGAMTAIDFYAGNQKIGNSQLFFLVQPPPGTPIMHTFTWTGAPAGTHTLTARGAASLGAQIVSAPLTITVGGNQLPAVQITSPANGAQFPSGTPVEIAAAATDPDGYANYAEFFANGHKLGDMRLDFLVPPPPGGTQTFPFTWRDAPPGSHMLSVRVRDNNGAEAVSAPVTINVSASDGLPVVVVLPADPFGVEPSVGLAANTASFRLRRYGTTAAALAVNYSLGGTATNGIDYTRLTGTAVFAAGESSAPVIVEPLADNLNEGRETVILQVEPQFDDGPERYHVAHHRRAIAVIADVTWQTQHAGNQGCTPLAGGLFHLCFPGTGAAPGFRVEATDDFLQWSTVDEGAPVDDAIHFIDPDTPGMRRRFYRMAPDTAAANP